MEYIGYPHRDWKRDYGVSFPDFPVCVTAGKTLDEARRLAAEALEGPRGDPGGFDTRRFDGRSGGERRGRVFGERRSRG